MTTYQILCWHDIPVQVRVGGRRDRVSRELPPRFQAAIDSAAIAAGLTGTDAYLDGFAWSQPHERDGSPEEVAEAVVAELDRQYETIDWKGTAVAIQQNPPI